MGVLSIGVLSIGVLSITYIWFTPYALRLTPYTLHITYYALRIPAMDFQPAILIFDGHCMLCDGLVQWLLKADTHQKLRFVAAQQPAGQALLARYDIEISSQDTVWLIWNNEALCRSAAVLRVAALLGFPYSLLRIGRIIPRFIRDAMYDFVAKRRHSWFGKREACRLPTAAERERFL